ISVVPCRISTGMLSLAISRAGSYRNQETTYVARSRGTAPQGVNWRSEPFSRIGKCASPSSRSFRISRARLWELVINRMDRNSAQAVRFLDNPEIRDVITRLIRDQVYVRIQDQSKAPAAMV